MTHSQDTRGLRRVAGVLVSAAFASTVLLCGDQSPTVPPVSQVVRLSAADAARLAKEARDRVRVEVPAGLELTLWAPQALVQDPVAIDFDARGAAYVTQTMRNNMPLDIRRHQDWMTTAHTLKTVAALRAFYAKEMAPSRSAENTWITDLNQDGSRDIRDLAEMKERVARIEDTDGDGFADQSTVVKEGFNHDPSWDVLGGVMYHDGDLFVGVPPGVYRLHDTDKDGSFDRQTTISDGFNVHPAFGGHGISGVTLGPDGRLYWEVGDMGFTVVDKAGHKSSYPNQGAVLRSELDGSGFEVFAAGIRNLEEFSFDEQGNLISVDNDGDHAGEHERLVHLTYGSDSGWRSNWQYGKYTDQRNNRYNVWMDEGVFKPRHDGQTAHVLPPIAPWHAGPSGMAYNPGTALTEDWRKFFFVSSFPGSAGNARVYGFTLKPDGATFTMASEKVLVRGILTVGMKFGPDGALYLTDWITGWDSKEDGRLWKVDAPGAGRTPERKAVQALLIEPFSARSVADLSGLLDHADMRVRLKAQFDLVRRADVDTLLAAAREPAHPQARLHGLWGVAQLARKVPKHASHLTTFLGDGDAEIRAQAARLLGDVRYAAAADLLIPLVRDAAPRVRFFAAEALARLAYKPAVAPLVAMLADNAGKDVYLQHTGSLALASIRDAAAIEALSTHESTAVRTAAVIALKRMHHAGVARFLADADEHIATDAARAINDDGGIAAAVPALAAVLARPRFDNEALLRRAINANLRVGSTEAVDRVTAFAADAGRPEVLRVEAIATLGVWAEPSPLDRVDGFYLTPLDAPGTASRAAPARARSRDAVAARAAVQRLIDAAAKAGDATANAEVKAALAEAAGLLKTQGASETLLAWLRSDASERVRLASLRALQAIGGGDMSGLMQVALADKDSAVRRGALDILPSLPIPAPAKVQHLTSLVERGELPEQQGALEILGRLKSQAARRALGTYLDALSAGKLAPPLQVDLLDAVQADGSAALVARLESYQKAQHADSVAAAFRTGLLSGGDAKRGMQVILQNPAGECTRCHTISGRGTDVGPELTRIGATLTREQLLDALVAPNARIAPGFGTVAVTLRSGQRVDGTLREETDTELVIVTGTPPTERRVAKAEVTERTTPLSAMPPLGLILKPREVRDVVEALARLK